MSGWVPKRFWKEASVRVAEGGFEVVLDGRTVKTPAKAALIVPTRAMAEAIAAEWDAQEEKINPATMPVTRGANAAIDKVRTQHAEVAFLIAEYGGTDLLCYRAEKPEELVARQSDAWEPLLTWAREVFGVDMLVTAGVLPVAQPEATLARLHQEVAALDPFHLAALHDLVGLTGSLVLGLAVANGRLDAATAWDLSRIEENWQIEHWGEDEEDAEAVGKKRDALLAAERFWLLLSA
ncbi:ATP12 family protein [Thioclava sp. A2]|uniref:ATP12 family chaperone protein n=1 Tax=Thioclava sp. FCG-A2 TaxID=3080562 RepID=UPI0029559948|nr:ATP12 family protein [Thioclava sp. A2]MDV7271075.1 ATP12 family protein [Thioclava sp. A2]